MEQAAVAPVTVGLVVVTHNSTREIERCLQAVHLQTRKPDRIVIADSGSIDGTLKLWDIDSGKQFIREHQLLADCVLSRDIPGAQKKLVAHLRSTINYVYPPGSEN